MNRRVSQRALYWRRVIHLRTLKASGISSWYSCQTDRLPEYLFEEAERCYRLSRTDSNMRVELEALGNMFMVKAVELDIKLQKIANGNYTASSPTRV